MPGGDDPYRVLGVAEDASAEEIRQAYRRAALRYHPDTYGGDPREGAQLFHHAHEAYKQALRAAILRDRAVREAGEGPKVPGSAPEAQPPRRQCNPPPIAGDNPALYPRRYRRALVPGAAKEFWMLAGIGVLFAFVFAIILFFFISSTEPAPRRQAEQTGEGFVDLASSLCCSSVLALPIVLYISWRMRQH